MRRILQMWIVVAVVGLVCAGTQAEAQNEPGISRMQSRAAGLEATAQPESAN